MGGFRQQITFGHATARALAGAVEGGGCKMRVGSNMYYLEG